MGELLDSVLESLASLVAGSDLVRGNVWPKTKADAFDGFEIVDPRIAEEDDFILHTSPLDIPVWPMDARWAMSLSDHATARGWGFKRICTLQPKAWRGRLAMVTPRMVEHHEFHVPPSGVGMSSIAPLALLKDKVVIAGTKSHPLGGINVSLDQIYGTDPRAKNTSTELLDVGFAHGFMLRREYLWSVLLGEENIPRARFVTDPLGVREAFRLRDFPPGKARRAALRHWVGAHWRKKGRASAEDRAWVREHLRGAQEFSWNGLRCRVEPSKEDARKNTPITQKGASP